MPFAFKKLIAHLVSHAAGASIFLDIINKPSEADSVHSCLQQRCYLANESTNSPRMRNRGWYRYRGNIYERKLAFWISLAFLHMTGHQYLYNKIFYNMSTSTLISFTKGAHHCHTVTRHSWILNFKQWNILINARQSDLTFVSTFLYNNGFPSYIDITNMHGAYIL